MTNLLQPGFHGVLCSNRRAECSRYCGKCLLDLVILTLAAMLTMAIGVVGILIVLLENGRSVLVRQMLGERSEQQFVLLKLRTMTRVKRAECAISDPQDFTCIGRLLRGLSVDKLPQPIFGAKPTLLKSTR